MKIKILGMQGVAAFALCALFASSASAYKHDSESSGPYAYAFCGPKGPAVTAWYEAAATPSEYEERDAAWRVDKYKYCAVIVADLTEPEEVTLGKRVKACVAKYIPQPWDIDGPSHGPLPGRPWTADEIETVEECASAIATASRSAQRKRGVNQKKQKRRDPSGDATLAR